MLTPSSAPSAKIWTWNPAGPACCCSEPAVPVGRRRCGWPRLELQGWVAPSRKAGGGERLSDDQIESELNKVCALFVYVTDKDLFAEIYRNQLVSRGAS
jgi:hypothetical protein